MIEPCQVQPPENDPENDEDNVGNTVEEEYDFGKIRRRCEEEMRIRKTDPVIIEVAKLLKVKLHR
jgi:hypothetical protein